jgi:rRNA maturation endonuclease Nob1
MAKPKDRDIEKACLDCGRDVKDDSHCDYCGGPLHPDAPPGQRGRCTSNHEADCDQNPDND